MTRSLTEKFGQCVIPGKVVLNWQSRVRNANRTIAAYSPRREAERPSLAAVGRGDGGCGERIQRLIGIGGL